MLNYLLRPANTLAPSEIGKSIIFVFSLRDYMPKRGFLASAQRVTLQAKPSALKNRFTVNKILPEPCIKGIQIPIPINFKFILYLFSFLNFNRWLLMLSISPAAFITDSMLMVGMSA